MATLLHRHAHAKGWGFTSVCDRPMADDSEVGELDPAVIDRREVDLVAPLQVRPLEGQRRTLGHVDPAPKVLGGNVGKHIHDS